MSRIINQRHHCIHQTLIMYRHDLNQSLPRRWPKLVIQCSSTISSSVDKFLSTMGRTRECIHYKPYLRNNINLSSWNLQHPTLFSSQCHILCGGYFIWNHFNLSDSIIKKNHVSGCTNFLNFGEYLPCGDHFHVYLYSVGRLAIKKIPHWRINVSYLSDSAIEMNAIWKSWHKPMPFLEELVRRWYNSIN